MASPVYIPKQHLVLATERTPAGFRYDNQARLVEACATNPMYACTDDAAQRPRVGQCRSGNGASDLGLGGRWINRPVAGLGSIFDMLKAGAAGTPEQQYNAARAELNRMESQVAARGSADQFAQAKNEMRSKVEELRLKMEAATDYQDDKGNIITKAQYDKLMADMAPKPVEPIYKDASGNVITQQQYNALLQAANQAKQNDEAWTAAARKAFEPLSRNMQAMERANAFVVFRKKFIAEKTTAANAAAAKAAIPAVKQPPKKIVVVKKLPKKPLNGLGESNSPIFLVGLAALAGIYLLSKQK